MDTDAKKTKRRNSRWDREPVPGPDGRPVVARLTNRDIEIFKLLARYTYLPLDDIHAFVGGSLKGLSQHMNVLSRRPNLYLCRPHQQRQSADANYRRLIYQLDVKGAAALRELGAGQIVKRQHRNFNHELMASRIMASIELGARRSAGIRLITWSEILASRSMPSATRNSAAPARVPVSLTLRGARLSISVLADGEPFGIERTGRDGSKLYLFFPGVEADCGTEPIDASAPFRSSIYKKFVAYQEIVSQRIHHSHFGFPNLFVPIITTTRSRMVSMMKVLARITGGHGSKMFLFKTFPPTGTVETDPKAAGHMFSEPWLRVGFDPLSLAK